MESVGFLEVLQGLLIPVLISVAGGLVTAMWLLYKRIDRVAERAQDQLDKSELETRRAQENFRVDLQTFQVTVATSYVPNEYLRQLESRIMNALQRLEDKFDRLEGATHG